MQGSRNIIFIIFAMFLWGSMISLIKDLIGKIPPFTLTTLIFLIGLIFVFPFAYKQGFKTSQIAHRNHVIFGLMGVVLGFGLLHMGLLFISVQHTLMIQSLAPVCILVLSWSILTYRPNEFAWSGICVALIGVFLTIQISEISMVESSWLGYLLVILSVISFSFYVFIGKQQMFLYKASVSHVIGMINGLIFLLPITVIELWLKGLPAITLKDGFEIIYLGIGLAGGVLWFWLTGLREIRIDQILYYLFLIPFFAVIFDFVRHGSLEIWQWLGEILIIIGVWLGAAKHTQKSKKKPASS
ncbi:EamA-like transporter family protein [Seinonella peptonophila]|uniref:EamA-like transporter family protein n=1 Tax=Seinonella peptonophila TaxID=112248 RepID=A0A1M4X4X9_9BACL|nr:DMT family transporter [Seinonella peptonophila]SHE88544.1 EamA-like transporter family protein [Seinonella peptonophila]